MWTSREVDDFLHQVLHEIFAEQPELFPPDITNIDEITKHYQSFRTFRRSSDTRALERNISSNDIDVVNRWKTVEEAQGKRPDRSMKQYYAQIELLICPFLRYTHQM